MDDVSIELLLIRCSETSQKVPLHLYRRGMTLDG